MLKNSSTNTQAKIEIWDDSDLYVEIFKRIILDWQASKSPIFAAVPPNISVANQHVISNYSPIWRKACEDLIVSCFPNCEFTFVSNVSKWSKTEVGNFFRLTSPNSGLPSHLVRACVRGAVSEVEKKMKPDLERYLLSKGYKK